MWALTRHDGHRASASTVLRARDLLQPVNRVRERRQLAGARRAAFLELLSALNQVWQLDFSEFETSRGGTWRITRCATVDAALVEQMTEVLRETGLPAQRLSLELTEGALMREAETSACVLRALRRLGVRISIDDFGTGYSSLSYLRRFPVDVIKVDRAFVQGLTEKGDDHAIVSAIIGMAHAPGMRALAEASRTPGSWRSCASSVCDAAQGYLFGRPAASFPSLSGDRGQTRTKESIPSP